MITQNLVVGDIVRRVPGTREQVDPSTNRGGGLRAVVGKAVITNPIAAAAAGYHQTVVTVVMRKVVGHVVIARRDQDDPFPRRDAEGIRWRALRGIVAHLIPLNERVRRVLKHDASLEVLHREAGHFDVGGIADKNPDAHAAGTSAVEHRACCSQLDRLRDNHAFAVLAGEDFHHGAVGRGVNGILYQPEVTGCADLVGR